MVQIKGIYDSANKLHAYFDQVDVFISAISGEERYDRGFHVLQNCGIQPATKVLFYFNEVLSSIKTPTEDDFNASFNLQPSDLKLKVDLYNEIGGLLEFKKYLVANHEKFEHKNIIVDFSVMVKPYFYLLIKHLSTITTNRLGFIYTEPETYSTLTKGTVDTKDMPSYSGKRTPRKKDALAILLGFEGNRAVAINNEINPDLTIPINGFPAFQPIFKDISILDNRELLIDEEIFKNLTYAPALDPFETKDVLEDIYYQHTQKYNFSIAPLGTKPMSLGSCFFAIEHPDVRIIYQYPQEYLPKASKGWRESWLYITDFISDASDIAVCPT
jgi:hypothetical protein